MICDYKGFINIFNIILETCCLKIELDIMLFVFGMIIISRFSVINISYPKDKKFFIEHKGMVGKIMKLVHPKYGECLITIDDYKIKLWTIKNESPQKLKKCK